MFSFSSSEQNVYEKLASPKLPTVASPILFCRAMLRLLGEFVWLNFEITSNLCDSFKRLALPDIICE